MVFQVAATAIPTLLIAVAVGLKQGTLYAKSYAAVQGWRRWMMVLVALFVNFSIVLGEFAALGGDNQGFR